MLKFLEPSSIAIFSDRSIEPAIVDALMDASMSVTQRELSDADFTDPSLADVNVVVIASESEEMADQAVSTISTIRKTEALKATPIVCLGFSPRLTSAGETKSLGLLFSVKDTTSIEDKLLTIRSAVGSANQFRSLLREASVRESAIGLIRSGVFELETLQEAEHLATMLSKACPDPSVAAFVLMEIMVNGIEHGNLGISNEEKSQLLEAGTLQEEIARRAALPENLGKAVSVEFVRYRDRAEFVIKDSGEGFDWRRYLQDVTQDSEKLNGRGLRLAFALESVTLRYSGNGNTATLVLT
ncbi:hypothetical protein EOI86_00180 [Hwanghaeella grinnelliae]|uniref:Uncharacterized protein n=1 Tax=Hwanghaeella grinnelliae TaxID=2500179 RepID=A0A437QTC2_9PROT|nr:ATP-binding protein [Hwanghaeella grinnelliae]RVU37761.1 hypothetical protein EOI86_00180 [Hwanghaeella grinnelliae]